MDTGGPGWDLVLQMSCKLYDPPPFVVLYQERQFSPPSSSAVKNPAVGTLEFTTQRNLTTTASTKSYMISQHFHLSIY